MNVFYELAPENSKGRHMLSREYLHLVIADDESNVRPVRIEYIRESANRLLAAGVPLAANLWCNLYPEIFLFPQRDQFVERVRLAFIEMLRICPIGFDPLRPDLRRDGKHRPVRCA